MTLETASEFARRHDSRIGITMSGGSPLFYFFTAAGQYISARTGPAIRAMLADADAIAGVHA